MSDRKLTDTFSIGDVLVGTLDSETVVLALVGTKIDQQVLFLDSLTTSIDAYWDKDFYNTLEKIGSLKGLRSSLLRTFKEENIT